MRCCACNVLDVQSLPGLRGYGNQGHANKDCALGQGVSQSQGAGLQLSGGRLIHPSDDKGLGFLDHVYEFSLLGDWQVDSSS